MENNIDIPKILVIGSKGHRYVDCVEWNNVSSPNIVDYHVVIVNVRSISDEFINSISGDIIRNLRYSLIKLLFSEGQLIVLSDYPRQVKKSGKDSGYQNNYFWSPIIFGFKRESGNTIKFINNVSEKYFSKFNKWEYYFVPRGKYMTHELIDFFGYEHNTKYSFWESKDIVNRYDGMLSGTIRLLIYKKKSKLTGFDAYNYYGDKPDLISGDIILLPLISELDDREASNLVLEDLIGKPQTSLPPSWSDKIKMPFIDAIDSNIESHQKEINNQLTEISELEKSKLEIEGYKKLLYTDGPELEEIFKKCLNELGAKVVPAKYSDEEYCLVYNEEDYPVEAKGVSKSIALEHLRQLRDYMDVYEEKTGKESHGILLGNAWKNIPIEERNSKEKPIFPNNVIKRATNLNISLVSSVDFFNTFCSFLEKKSLGQKIIDKIVNSVGVVNF